MEPKVQLLDPNTANQIAAGEVVEKPASVIKELVENALDAGADKIQVSIFAGGTEYMRVEDNGCGMSEENARVAVLRHATSKLVAAKDLLTLTTLGFRGEALPSIASVSRFTLLTRPTAMDMATSITIEGGQNMQVEQAGASAGTTVIVKDLFYNVPARRKFLKTVATEGRYISELMTKLALSRPDVAFKLMNNEKLVLQTPGDGSLMNTIRALYGKATAGELLPVEFSDGKIKITGFIGKPTLLKSTRQWQTLFVNNRVISNKMLAKAIDHAYQSQIPKSGFPFAVLKLTVDTNTIDVNVHPQKSEIKFSDEGLIYRGMYKALTDALTRPMEAKRLELLEDNQLQGYRVVPAGQGQYALGGNGFGGNQIKPASNGINRGLANQGVALEEALGSFQETVRPKRMFAEPVQDIFKSPEPKKEIPLAEAPKPAILSPGSAADQSLKEKADKGPQGSNIGLWEGYEGYQTGSSPVVAEGHFLQQVDKEPCGPLQVKGVDAGIDNIWPLGQVDKTFIIAQSETALYLIDQHAAHERILFDKLVTKGNRIPVQQLLLPLYLDMPEEDITLLEENKEACQLVGVDIVAAGEGVVRLSSLPVDITCDGAQEFLLELCVKLRQQGQLQPSDLRQELLHMTACKAAIKAGQLLNLKQMRQLIQDLCNTEHPFTCPHGRPCMLEITSDKLYKMFKRTGF